MNFSGITDWEKVHPKQPVFLYSFYVIKIDDLKYVCEHLPEGSHSILKEGTLEFTMQKKPIIFKESDAILLIIRSFTNVENMQRRATEDKFRNVLLSTISHDIKTPLTAIQNNLSLLLDYIPEAGKDFYNATCIATKALEYYLFDIIVLCLSLLMNTEGEQDMKKIFEGTFALNLSLVSMKQLFATLQPLVEFPAKVKNIALRLETTINKKLELDERRLTQVLLNLASNAIKYTIAGNIDIIATESAYSNNTRKLIITVADTGIGIKPEHLQEIFKIFGLADEKKELTGTGVGMGLYLSKYIINKMDGTLDVNSELGKGTTVTIEIPITNIGPECEPTNGSTSDIPKEICTVLLYRKRTQNSQYTII
eukprot:TRINITY_DN120180_c0_g1_i1.p1 TRINITY_DN120180_c0_g1~~TRINITY_DN120180_c0_g1_i1.p1  ORF type:complete len:367 (-),score=36.23 TRINITY_DN120180_c0_g1_i1:708-1808(-)